ncbi:MAG: NADH-quinone oxidoreductase subunit J [Thermoplasmata archaeon]|jgi:NADH-quinone oxidoreductase subunit J
MIFTIIFLIFALFLVITSLEAVREKNIVHSATWLMMFLFTMGGLFIFMGASFLGAIELLVYVGAVVTLIVFTLMLTGGKEVE